MDESLNETGNEVNGRKEVISKKIKINNELFFG